MKNREKISRRRKTKSRRGHQQNQKNIDILETDKKIADYCTELGINSPFVEQNYEKK